MGSNSMNDSSGTEENAPTGPQHASPGQRPGDMEHRPGAIGDIGANSSDDRNPVERLAEEFLARRRRGEHPPLTEYVDRHPEWADEIRELFPALVMIERIKPAAGDVTGSFVGDGRS